MNDCKTIIANAIATVNVGNDLNQFTSCTNKGPSEEVRTAGTGFIKAGNHVKTRMIVKIVNCTIVPDFEIHFSISSAKINL